MKRISFFLFVFILSLSILSCFDPPVDPPSAELSAQIEFYFLADSNLTDMSSLSMNLDSLELADEPWLTQEDIEYYEWAGHIIYLKNTKQELLPEFYANIHSFDHPTPFVVTVDSVPVYLGCFDGILSAMGNATPSISEAELGYYPDDILSYFYLPSHPEDRRDNPLFKQALIYNDQYQGGLEIELDLDHGMHFTFYGDSTVIEYRLTLRNCNDKALYVLDPARCGTNIFYYINNVPCFTSIEDWTSGENSDFWPGDEVLPDSSELANLIYYTRIPAGDTLSMSLQVGGYDDFQPGSYYFYQYFKAFIPVMDLQTRTKDRGRIWVGWTWMPAYQLSYPGGNFGTLTEFDAASLLGKISPKKPLILR
jgi:hypothetical protein